MARKATKQLEDQGYSPLEAYSIGLHEFWKSLRKAGFTTEIALAIIVEKSAYPDWILPSPINPNIPEPDWYDDDDED
jgi:hypothetical protein